MSSTYFASGLVLVDPIKLSPTHFAKKKVSFLKGSSSDNSVGKESACNAGDLGLIPGLGRSTGEGIDYLFQDAGASLMA